CQRYQADTVMGWIHALRRQLSRTTVADMHFTRPRELVAAGLAGFVLGYLVFEFAYGSLPRLPTFAGITLIVLAVIEVALAISIRNRIRDRRLVAAIWVARA